eukprot:359139-Chlamydomonas_euryale.AAC.16
MRGCRVPGTVVQRAVMRNAIMQRPVMRADVAMRSAAVPVSVMHVNIAMRSVAMRGTAAACMGPWVRFRTRLCAMQLRFRVRRVRNPATAADRQQQRHRSRQRVAVGERLGRSVGRRPAVLIGAEAQPHRWPRARGHVLRPDEARVPWLTTRRAADRREALRRLGRCACVGL